MTSLREGRATPKDAYARFTADELFPIGVYAAPYGPSSQSGHAMERDRRLLIYRAELSKPRAKLDQKGITLVPCGST